MGSVSRGLPGCWISSGFVRGRRDKGWGGGPIRVHCKIQAKEKNKWCIWKIEKSTSLLCADL
jgi:hypothetical protein